MAAGGSGTASEKRVERMSKIAWGLKISASLCAPEGFSLALQKRAIRVRHLSKGGALKRVSLAGNQLNYRAGAGDSGAQSVGRVV